MNENNDLIDHMDRHGNVFIGTSSNFKKFLIDISNEVNIERYEKFIEFKGRNYYIFDEFDSLYNPIKSEFNIIDKEGGSLGNKYNEVFIQIWNNIDNRSNITFDEQTDKELLVKTINNSLDKVNNIKINEKYGRSILFPKKVLVIPYKNAKDPNENSSFSNYILTIILTLYYYSKNKLNIHDWENLYYHSQFHNNEKKRKFYMERYIEKIVLMEYFEVVQDDNNYSELLEKLKNGYFDINLWKDIYDDFKDIFNKKEVKIKYILESITKEIKINDKQNNISFTDILFHPCILFKTGFSGTINVELPKYPIKKEYKITNLVNDKESKGATYVALLGITNKNNEEEKQCPKIMKIVIDNTLFGLSIKNECNLLKKLMRFIKENEYDCLIDLYPLFKILDTIKIVECLIECNYENYFDNKDILFVDNLDNNKRKFYNCNNKKFEDYNEKIYENKSELFIIYSQRDIVGIDFKQPIGMKGFVIINKNVRMSDVSQAVFRLRKLNKSHYFDYLVFNNDYNDIIDYDKINSYDINNNIKILDNFIENEKKYLSDSKSNNIVFNIKALNRYNNEYKGNTVYEEKIFDKLLYNNIKEYLGEKYCNLESKENNSGNNNIHLLKELCESVEENENNELSNVEQQ